MSWRDGTLSRHGASFKGMTGLTVALFDDLVWAPQPALAAAPRAARERPGRQRAVGGGHPSALDGRAGLPLTVSWLRHDFTQETRGYVRAVCASTARRVSVRGLPVPEQAGRATMRQPPPARRARLGGAEALRAGPARADLGDASRVVEWAPPSSACSARRTVRRRIGTTRATKRRTRSRRGWWWSWAAAPSAPCRPGCRGRSPPRPC